MKKSIKYPFREGASLWRALAYKSNYLWRVVATGMAFVLFGMGGLLAGVTLLPVIILSSRDPYQRASRTRVFIRHSFKFFLNILEFWGLIKIKTKGLENLKNLRGVLVICNHPSLLDVLIIISRLENIQCVVKNKLWLNPVVNSIITAAGYIRNDMHPQDFLECCQQQLRQGENIIIFPEGTRTTPGEPVKVLRGLGNLALAAQADIQALTLDCNPILLPKGRRWYKIPPKRAVFQLQAGRMFLSADYQNDAPRSIRVRALMRDIQQYYNGVSIHE